MGVATTRASHGLQGLKTRPIILPLSGPFGSTAFSKSCFRIQKRNPLSKLDNAKITLTHDVSPYSAGWTSSLKDHTLSENRNIKCTV